MKAKKLLSLLLALIMCAGLVPAQVLAAGNMTLMINTEGIENGTVEIVSIPDGATQDGNTVTGLTAKTSFVTVKATPKEGYEFLNWTVKISPNGTKWLSTAKPNSGYVLKSGQTFASNPIEIANGTMAKFLQLTPNFGIPLKLAVESSDPEMGEVVLGPNTGKQLTEKTEKGYVGSYNAGNVEIGYRLKDSEKYQFVGWAIRYTNGESGITEDLDPYHYMDLSMRPTTTWPYDKNPWSKDDTVVGNTVRDLISYNRKGIKHDATITAVFNDKTSPNYALQDSYWNIRMYVILQSQTVYYPTITGWDNTTNEVVVEFNDVPSADVLKSAQQCHIYMPIGKSGTTGITAPGLAINFTDDAPKYTYKDENKLEYGFGQYTIDDFADAYEIHFNVLDNNGNTKPGVIRLNLKNRGKLTAEHGAVQYLGKQYENGSVIDFVPDGDGEATMTAVPEEGYKLLKWIINGTEYPANGNDITFAVPESTFDIQAVFAAPEFVVAGKTPRFDIRDNLLEFTPFVTLATEGTVTGWSNDTDEQVVVTFNNVGTLPQYVAAYYKLNSDSYAPDGTSLSFDGRETGDKGSWLSWSRYYYTQLNADDYEIPFTITDKNGFVKRGVIRFERDGKAGIEAEHGSVIYNDTEYTNGQTIDVAAGEITIQAKADEGYAFAGWEIGGKEYSDNPLTIEADSKFFIIKAKFAKLVTVSTGEGIVSEGAAKFADDETAESKTVAAGRSVSITNVPGEKSKFVAWHVEYEKAEGKFMTAEEGRHYALGEGTGLTDGTITIVTKEYNLRVYPEFERTYSITLQQAEGGKASFAEPISAIGKDAVSGLTKDSNAVTWELESTETGYKFTKWGIEYFDTAKNEWVADPTLAGSFVTYRFWTPVNGDGRQLTTMSAQVTKYDLRITPQFSKGLTIELVADPAAGGKVEASGDTDGYFYTNNMAFVTATANDGYEFNGWTVEYKQEDGTYAPAELAKHYSPFGSLDDADLGVRMKDYSLRFTAKFTKQLYVELAQGEHGTAEFVGVTPDANNRVYGPDDSTGNIVATVKATPEEGYAFGGWTILNADTGKKAVGLMGKQYMNYVLADGESAASNPLNIGFSNNSKANFHINLKLVPVFNEAKEIIIVSDNPEYGTVTPDGSTQISLGGLLDITAKPAEGCMFMGWEVVYADGSSFSSDKDRGNVYGLKTSLNNTAGETNTIKLYNGEKVLKVIGHFVKAGDPNFVVYNWNGIKGIMGLPDFAFRQNPPIASNSIVGWNNNTDEEIVVTFNTAAVEGSMGIGTTYSNGSGLWVAPGVKFDLGEDTYTMAGSNVVYMKEITEEQAATLYELPFTATDAYGNVKKGVIRFTPARRALIEAENGAVSYNDATYAAGSIIDFPAGEATITAAANEGYAFAGWEIEGVELSEEQAKSETLTFTVPEKFFTIKARFEVAAKQLYVELAQGEHGTAEFVGVTPDANNRVYGPDDSTGNIVATVKATPEEGYVFGGWEVVNGETGNSVLPSKPGYSFYYEIADGGTVASNPMSVGFSKSGMDSYHVNLKIKPVFGKGIKVTVGSDNSAYGTVTPEGENIISGTNGRLDFSAKPADGCLFMGWEVTYADGTEIPDAEKGNMFMFNVNTVDNDETGDNNQLLTFNCEKDLKLTAHFVKKGEPNFVRYNSNSSYAGSKQIPRVTVFAPGMTLPSSYTGWSNDISEPIVITFDAPAMESKSGLRLFYRFKTTDLTAAGVTFDLGEGTENSNSSASTKYFIYYFTEEQAATLYELPFTATDANGNVKKGVIRFTPARRALIEAENGAVSYNDATYAAGSIIDFPAGEATITAAANEGYAFAGWEIEGVELSEEQAKSETLTFTVPEKFFTIKAKFEVENKVNVTLSVNEATYGTLTSESSLTGLKKGDKVELVAARNPDGYEDFLLWHISGTEGTDYTIDNDPEVPGKATLTVLGTKDVSVMAVFRGKVVGLQPSSRKYAIMPVKHGQRLIITYLGHQDVKVGVTEVTGWNNNPNEPLAVTITLDNFNDGGSLVVLKKYMGMMRDNAPDILAPGASYVFPGMEDRAGTITGIGAMYLHFTNGWDRTKTYHFSIVDESGNVLKNGTVEFRAKGLAKIDAENGAVEFDGSKYNNGEKVYLGTGSATITAAANEGYAFAGWEIEGVELSEEQAKSETLTFTVPEKFFTIKAKFEADTTPGIKVTVKSENAAKGSAAAITEGLDNFKPNGTSIIELSAAPAANCTLVGWTVTDTASGEYLDKSLYTLYEEGENKLLLAKGVDKDVTVTAYFANSTEGVFVMPGERLPAFTITGKDGTVYTGAIENWDNNTYNEIVVTFSGFGTSDILGQDMLITLSNGSSDVLAPTDLVMKRTDAGDGKEEVVRHEDGGKVYYSLSDYQRESRIPFTFTDRNGNVKKGTIKLNLDYRAEVYVNGFCQPSGDRLGGYVLYNGNKYYSGDVIPFEPDAEGYVTITAVPEEKFANIEYVFKNWKMDTVELTEDEVYTNPLKFKPSKEYCVIQPQFAGDGRLVVVTDAENGRAEFKKNGELVEGGEADGIAYGTDKLSVEAIPDDGYVFVRWQVEMNNSITDPDSWVGEKFTEDEQARLLARNTSLSESDIREAKLDFTLEGGIYALRLTPLFGLDAKGATITLDNSESEKGTISSEDDLTDVRWYLPAVTIKAEKKDGYEFQGWTVTSTATGKRLYNGKDYEMVEVDEYTMTIRPLRTSTQDMTVKGIFPEYQPVHGTVKGHGYAVVYEGKEYREGDVITFPNGKGIATLEWKPDNADAHFVYWFFSDYVMNNESEARRQPRIDVQLLERDFEINVTMGYHVDYRIMCDGVDITRSDDWGNATGTNIYSLQGRESYDISKYPTIDDAIDNYSEIARNSNSINYAAPGDGVIFWFDENFRLGGNVINGRVKYVYDSITIEPAAEEIGIAKRLIDKQYGGYEDKSDEYRVWAAYVMPESDITIVINIRRVSYSQITAQPNNTAYGSVTISPEAASGDGYYKEGTYLRINAAAKSGYRFVKWEEAQGSSYLSEEQKLSSSLNLKVGADSAALTAVFEEDTNPVAQALNLVVEPAGKANVLVNGAKGVAGAFEGESVTVSLGDLDDYYEFDHWEITRDSSGESLITSAASYSESITFVMPNGSVTVKAVLNERAIGVGWRYWIKKGDNAYTGSSVTTPYMADISIWKNGVLQDPNSKITVVKGDTISFEVKLKDPNKYILEKIWLVSSNYMVKNYDDYKGEYTVTSWKHRGKKIYGLTIEVYFDTNNGDIQRYNLNVVQPASGGTIECDSVYPLADSVVKLTAKPEENYRLKRWIVTDEYNNAVDVTVDDSDANSAKFTMPAADVTVTAEFEQTDASGAEILAVDILSGKGGAVIASGTLVGDAWTVDLSGVIDKATADGIPQGTSGLYMRITANEGTTVEQVNAFTGDWSNGDIACYMPLNQGVIFIAHNGEQSRNYTITLAYSEPGAPELSNGSAERISDKEANIKFTSSEGGSCYYVVVESGAAEPTIDTEGRGMSISAGENTLMLTNLAKGARDIYIVVKNASGVASKPMKIEIPAFSSGEDEGEYTISVAEHIGGTLTPSRTRANEGDEVTVSISAADGMQMKAGSLTYTEAIENGKTVTIENGKFTMPACDVTISCQWESTASQPTGGGITGFVIDGIPGTIDAGGNIVVTMPYKTDVTALRPVITGVNIAEMTPASGEAVDLTKPVIYTVTLTDGTVKLYTVTVQLQNAGAADELWDKLTDPSQTLPWWKYAEQQRNSGYYPRYW